LNAASPDPRPRPERAATGVPGLDDVLGGGLERGRLFLVEGAPGTGKTTLSIAFLLDGVARGEAVLYVTMSETADELRASAASHGWDLDRPGFVIEESAPAEAQEQSLLHSSDLELGETVERVFRRVAAVSPARVVLDGLSEIRLLAQGPLRYRQQVLAIKQRFARLGATVLLLDDMTTGGLDGAVHSVAHGVIRLEETAPEYGAERRRLRVTKYRGTRYRGGYHDFAIEHGGLRVFPRLVAAEQERGQGDPAGREGRREQVRSGADGLDALLGGGLERGTTALLMGPAGAGKSILALHYALAATAQGGNAQIHVFDEEVGLLADRAAALGFDLGPFLNSGRLTLSQVDPAEMSPGSFAQRVREGVERGGVRTVVIDSVNGYQLAMPDERFLLLHLRELITYLNRRGVLTILTLAQHGLVGDMQSPVDVTYLADTLVLLRYFEAEGRVRRALSVLKKRLGSHEDAIREYAIERGGLRVGGPLSGVRGVLSGVPLLGGGGGRAAQPAAPDGAMT